MKHSSRCAGCIRRLTLYWVNKKYLELDVMKLKIMWRRAIQCVFAALAVVSMHSVAAEKHEVVVSSVSDEEQRAAIAYWTPARVAETLAQEGVASQGSSPRTGRLVPQRVDPAGGVEMMSTGHLFFLANGKNSLCTANAVESATKSVIATAGHCVQTPTNRPGGPRIEHLVFLAHYRNGEWAGRFPVRNIFTVTGWSARGEAGFDFAFLSLAHDNYGSRVGDLVLASPIRFASPPTLGNFYLYGYPNAISSGELPQKCSGRAIESPLLEPGPELRIVRDCLNFSGGASGGPVMQTLPDGTYQTGNVKGYTPSAGGTVTFTYWENAAHGAWDRAQHDQ
ncbi:serine protease [Xanthomonas campestris pv. zinniae]|nr:serine protease [Xanthomonas campestris pv. zinniae]